MLKYREYIKIKSVSSISSIISIDINDRPLDVFVK